MGVRMKKKEPLILEAALKVFKQHGFYEAKISDIASEAGIGKGTVYEYFDNKKQLFEKTIIYMTEEYIKDAKRILKQEKEFKQKIILLAQYHGRFMEENLQTGESIITSSNVISREMIYKIMEIRKKFYEFMEDLIEEGIRKGELREDLDKRIMFLTIWGAISENYQERIFSQKTSFKDIDADSIISAIFQGISKSS